MCWFLISNRLCYTVNQRPWTYFNLSLDHWLTIATSIASWFERERSHSRRRAWSFAKLLVPGRYLSSKQMFSTVVLCINNKYTKPYLNSVQDYTTAQEKKIMCEYITHWRDFVSVENKCYVATAVIQMPAVRLALGGFLWRWGFSHGTNPPLITGGREASEVVVLQTILSSRAGLMSLVLAWRVEPTGTTATHHLVSQDQNIHLHAILYHL